MELSTRSARACPRNRHDGPVASAASIAIPHTTRAWAPCHGCSDGPQQNRPVTAQMTMCEHPHPRSPDAKDVFRTGRVAGTSDGIPVPHSPARPLRRLWTRAAPPPPPSPPLRPSPSPRPAPPALRATILGGAPAPGHQVRAPGARLLVRKHAVDQHGRSRSLSTRSAAPRRGGAASAAAAPRPCPLCAALSFCGHSPRRVGMRRRRRGRAQPGGDVEHEARRRQFRAICNPARHCAAPLLRAELLSDGIQKSMPTCSFSACACTASDILCRITLSHSVFGCGLIGRLPVGDM